MPSKQKNKASSRTESEKPKNVDITNIDILIIFKNTTRLFSFWTTF